MSYTVSSAVLYFLQKLSLYLIPLLFVSKSVHVYPAALFSYLSTVQINPFDKAQVTLQPSVSLSDLVVNL